MSIPGHPLKVNRVTIGRAVRKVLEAEAMPSKSDKQARTMAAAAHDKGFADKLGIPQKVAKEFSKADANKGGKGGKGRKAKGSKQFGLNKEKR